MADLLPAGEAGRHVGEGGAFRLSAQQNGHHPDTDARGHRQIDPEPIEGVGQDQGAAAGDQHADPIAVDIGRGANPLFRGRQAFNAIGVNDDVLRRRQEGHQNRQPGGEQRMVERIRRAQGDDRGHQRHLAKNQPAAPPPKPGGQRRQGQLVDHRRPQEFEIVGQTDQGDQPNRPKANAGLGHPRGEHTTGQGQRQTGGHAKDRDRDHSRLNKQQDRAEHLLGDAQHRLGRLRSGRRRGGHQFGQVAFRPGAKMADHFGRGDRAIAPTSGEVEVLGIGA